MDTIIGSFLDTEIARRELEYSILLALSKKTKTIKKV